jgi:hypothetical protein
MQKTPYSARAAIRELLTRILADIHQGTPSTKWKVKGNVWEPLDHNDSSVSAPDLEPIPRIVWPIRFLANESYLGRIVPRPMPGQCVQGACRVDGHGTRGADVGRALGVDRSTVYPGKSFTP